MKKILILSFLILANGDAFALDLKGKLLEAAKDKKNQEKAKEIAQKGVDYIKGDKKAEVKSEEVPVPAASPVDEKKAKKTKHKKKAKNKKPEEVKIP